MRCEDHFYYVVWLIMSYIFKCVVYIFFSSKILLSRARLFWICIFVYLFIVSDELTIKLNAYQLSMHISCSFIIRCMYTLYLVVIQLSSMMWLVDLIDWLADSLVDLLVDWLIDWMVDWLVDWLADWLLDGVNDWLILWHINGLNESVLFSQLYGSETMFYQVIGLISIINNKY